MSNIMSIDPVREALLAFAHEPHPKIGAKYSVTELLLSPRQRQLAIRNEGALQNRIPDPISLWRAFVGTGVHAMFEKYLRKSTRDWIMEGRVWDIIDGVRVSGLFDAFHLASGTLYDFKLTRVYKYKLGDFQNWTRQLNIYAWMLRESLDVRRLRIIGIWIDHFPQPFRKPDPTWPEDIITIVPLEKWKPDRAEAFVRERVRLHEEAEALPAKDLPFCTPKERWQTVLYKVMAPGRNTALRSSDSLRIAQGFIKRYSGKKYNREDLTINMVEGEPKRCARWCEGADFCNQWQDERHKWGRNGKARS